MGLTSIEAKRKIAIVQISRGANIHDVGQLLAREGDKEFFAFSPFSAFVLDKYSIPYKTLSDVIEPLSYQVQSLSHLKRIESILISDYGTHNLIGLSCELKRLVDLMWCETLKLAYFASCDLTIIHDSKPSDKRPTAASILDLEINVLSEVASYVKSFSVSRIEPVPPGKIERIWSRKNFRYLLTAFARKCSTIARKILLRLRPNKKVLIGNLNYDFFEARRWILAEYNVVSLEDFRKRLKSKLKPQRYSAQSKEISESLIVSLEKEFPHINREVFGLVNSSIREMALEYLSFGEQISSMNDEDYLANSFGCLLTYCNNSFDFLMAINFKNRNAPALFFQHGSYMQRNEYIKHYELIPATCNFCYGSADSLFFKETNTAVVEIGSLSISKLREHSTAPRNKRVIYVLDVAGGDLSGAVSSLIHGHPDDVELYKRHTVVIDLFGKNLDWHLSLRPHPSHYSIPIYEPLKEYVAQRGYKNISFDHTPYSADVFLEKGELIILDYICTTLIQCLSKNIENVICYAGSPYLIPLEDRPHLSRIYSCPDNPVDFEWEIEQFFLKRTSKEKCKEAAAFLSAKYIYSIKNFDSIKSRLIEAMKEELPLR